MKILFKITLWIAEAIIISYVFITKSILAIIIFVLFLIMAILYKGQKIKRVHDEKIFSTKQLLKK
jgi:hypothetical protein